MGTPYQSQSASGYNSSPPPDDGTTVAANKITWSSTIKAKLADPIKVLADAINTALRAALNVTPSTTSIAYTTLVGDHLTTIEVTGTTTISLGDAATMIAQSMGYTVTVYNKDTTGHIATVNLATNTNKLNGNTNGTMTLAPGQAATFTVAQSGTDYEIKSVSGFQEVILTGAAGTNTVTANAPGSMIGLYAGLRVILIPANTNTGATTLNITPSGGSALTAKSIFANNAACGGGELVQSAPALLEYDGTQFQIIGTGPSVYLTSTQTLTNKTLTAPVLGGTATGTYTLGGTPTITAPTITGTITLSSTPFISAGTNSVTWSTSNTAAGTIILSIADGSRDSAVFYCNNDGTAYNGANAVQKIRQAAATARSINAAGTVNASGADYAEYETKREDCADIAKGAIVGFDENGLLTDKWALAVTFGVKSTAPSYVGGDAWGVGLEGDALEAARQKVDRIAYAGKVPINVLGAKVGQWINPAQDGDGIKGVPGEWTPQSVGQVRKILPDGRAEIAL